MDGANEIDGYLYSITIGTVEREYNYIQKLSQYLRDDWEFNRLSVIEQAILLMSAQEILGNGTPKKVVINEALEIAKQKMINQMRMM